MKGVIILLNIFLFAFVLSKGMRGMGSHMVSDLPLLALGIVCLVSACFFAAGQNLLKKPFAKKALITLNLLAVAFALITMAVDKEGKTGEVYLVTLMLIALLNTHVLIVQKSDWSDRFLARPFFAKKRFLKAILLPVAALILLSIPTDLKGYSYVWPNIKGYIHFKYDSNWTGVYISPSRNDSGVVHPSRFVHRGFKSKEECVEGGRAYGFGDNKDSAYICGKKCLYDDFGYGFCLQRD